MNPSTHLTIRAVPARLARALAQEAKRRGQSRNRTAVDLLARALGLSQEPAKNGLETLAGSWSDEDLKEFERATAFFSTPDEELWK